ncbi:MAG: DNA polymerase III subunit gamma/tau [Planctomycetaceae bacterium]|nr:DNA polymerase III subunit gamma/tau [Planctomycetaceae bacterium]
MSQSEPNVPPGQPRDSEHYQVVARRYRPQGFAQLVGQRHVSQALSNAIQTGRIGHAYLFTGARGVGKTSSARIFAKALNCTHGPTPTPCNVCEICDSISTGEDVDVLEIDGASNRGIDEIRQLRQNASIRPSRANFKIYIIDEVHMLTREAFNALLKTLEEPPEHVKFIFCTTEPSKIPITILSRCQRYDFAGIDAAAITERLAEIAQKEGVTAEEDVLETLARRAAGSMRDAQSLLEQLLSFAPEHITLADVHAMLGTADDQRIFRILASVNVSETASIFTELDAAAQEGVDFGIFTEQLLGVFRDLMLSACDGDKQLLMYCAPSRYDEVKQLARELGLHRILAAMQVLDQTYTKMRYSTQGRILLELALVRIANLQQLQGVAMLIEQLRNGTLSAGPSHATPAGSPNAGRNEQASATPDATRFSDMLPPKSARPSPPSNTGPEKKNDVTVRSAVTNLVPEAAPDVAPAFVPGPATAPPMLHDAELQRYWETMTGRLSGMVASQATLVHSVRWAPPDGVVATFPSTQPLARTYCENDSQKIQAVLCELSGVPLRLRFETLTVEEPKKPIAPPVHPAARKMQLLAETSEHPMVKKAAELFGATLAEVKPGTNKSRT